jgi:hypothetical protein
MNRRVALNPKSQATEKLDVLRANYMLLDEELKHRDFAFCNLFDIMSWILIEINIILEELSAN